MPNIIEATIATIIDATLTFLEGDILFRTCSDAIQLIKRTKTINSIIYISSI